MKNGIIKKISVITLGAVLSLGAGIALGHKDIQRVKADEKADLPAGNYSFTLSIEGTSEGYVDSPKTFTLKENDGDTVFKTCSLVLNHVQNNYANEFTMPKNDNDSYVASNNTSNATITTIEIDWYNYDNPTVYKGTAAVEGKEATKTNGTNSSNNKSKMRIYEINDSDFYIANATSYANSFYTIKVNLRVAAPGYSIIYNANDSSTRLAENMPGEIFGVEDGETRDLSGTPTRWGYSFLGWGLTSDATSYVTQATVNGGDKTVYAIWGEDHTIPGAWSDSPYTVAQAITAIDNGVHLSDVYAEGIISQIDSYNSSYHSLQYWISDDGTTTNQLEIYSGKNLNNTDFSATTDIELGATVTIRGNLKKYNTTYEFDLNNYQVAYTAPQHDIEFTFTPSIFYAVGKEGTFSYTCDVEGVEAAYESSNPEVLNVNSSTGAYSALAAGTADITLTLTKGTDTSSKKVTMTVAAVKTVSEARTIASGLDSSATTEDYYYVRGYISNLDADGNSRAVNITDGSNTIMIYFGGGSSLYTTVSTTAKIGSKVAVFGKIQNYNSTYELKDITLDSVEGGDADSYAAGAYASLNAVCEVGVDEVTVDLWTAAANGFNALSQSEQAKLQANDVTPYGQNVIKWVARYEIIVNNTELNNFMSRGTASSSGLLKASANTDYSLLVIVSLLSTATLFGATLIHIKKKHN